jgi:hypothetical protein
LNAGKNELRQLRIESHAFLRRAALNTARTKHKKENQNRMKNTSITVAMVFGVSLIISAAMLSSAIKSYGRSLEIAAANQPRSFSIPSSFSLDLRLSDNGRPMRFDVTSKP